MKNTILYILATFFFLIICSTSKANKWDEIGGNAKKKSVEESARRLVDKNVVRLETIILQDKKVIASQAKKLVKMRDILETSSEAYINNQRNIKIQKEALRNAWAQNPTSDFSISIQKNLTELRSESDGLKKAWERNQHNISKTESSVEELGQKLLKNKKTMYLLVKTAGKVIEYTDGIAAGAGTFGEIAAWWEGSSSFKNVVLRATKEGGKAAVSIGTGIVVGASTAVSTWNPFLAGAAVISSSIAAEEAYEASAGKYLGKIMDNEYRAIVEEKYKPGPEELRKIQEAKRKRAFEENKKLLKDISSKQDEYNAELEKYIEERNHLWSAFEEKMRKDAEEEYKLKLAERPNVVQVPNKKKIKPGETVTITVKTTGGLLPIKYSGFINYTVHTGYDRYLVSYKWTPDKKTEPGVYEFPIKATSVSKKVGSHTLTIEVIDPNPAPPPTPKPTENFETDTDGERLYSADELNIKEIPGAKIREMIYKVNGIYYGHCETQSNIKTQKFEIRLGVDPGNIEGKLGLAQFGQFAGSKTLPMTESMKEAVLVKLRKQGLPENAPYPEYLDNTYSIYFHAWGRERKFDPVSGRIWGEIEGEWSTYDTYVWKKDFKGFLEAKLNNGVITGTIKFPIKGDNYSFTFTAKQ